MKCPHCKGEIFPGQFICDHCGKIVKVEKPKEEKTVKEKKKNGK